MGQIIKQSCTLLLIISTLIHISTSQYRNVGNLHTPANQECSSCIGFACRRVTGIFTRPVLQLGYNLITRIPSGSCNITVSEIRPSSNYLAIRSSNGYIINGNWNVVPSGRYMGAGTGFNYMFTSNVAGQFIRSRGPINVDIDIMLIYQSTNPGIRYDYWHPISKRPVQDQVSFLPQQSTLGGHLDSSFTPSSGHRRLTPETAALGNTGRTYAGNTGWRKSRGRSNNPYYLKEVEASFVRKPEGGYDGDLFETKSNEPRWKVWKFTPCTKTCGGGEQETVYICTTKKGEILDDSHCLTPKPQRRIVTCNAKPCPPQWVLDDWSPCSVTCGTGQRSRSWVCVQEMSPLQTRTLMASSCPPNPAAAHTPTVQLCTMAPCTRWNVGEWGKCSVQCGTGLKRRLVTCMSGGIEMADTLCNQQEKPRDRHLCHAHVCAQHTWFFTEWTEECYGGCENGVHRRHVWCSPGANSIMFQCSSDGRPRETKPCTTLEACGAQWFTGPFTKCSSLCGNGTQSREVVCVVYMRGTFRATMDIECNPETRPPEENVCEVEHCPPHWYYTDWTECSRQCGRGVQRRAVQCLTPNQKPSLECKIGEQPKITRVCNAQPCEASKDSHCVDRFQNCLMVEKARLCRYSYYNSVCCASCLQQSTELRNNRVKE